MKKYTITLNNREYITTNCIKAWAFTAAFPGVQMDSKKWEGVPIMDLVLNKVDGVLIGEKWPTFLVDMSELFI